MKKLYGVIVIMGALAGATNAFSEGGANRFGLGVNYWTAVSDIDVDNIDNNGFSYVFSYQYKPEWLGLGVDAEMLPDRFGQDSWAPQAYLLLGKAIYGGAGVGWLYSDGDFANDPFFSFRVGLDLEVLPHIHLDVYGQYRFESTQDLEDEDTEIDTDTIFLGAAVRIAL
jgi:hypothetical protein